MAAALAHSHLAHQRGEGLQPTHPVRDLRQIAELIEACFGPDLDAGGRSAVAEMKLLARLVPLLWLVSVLDVEGTGLGRGYVWRVRNRVVGNVSLYRGGTHPHLGRGWLIANVAVHPDYRRQGIARALMQAALRVAFQHGRWAALQVEADNTAAIALYESLGFERFETLAQWRTGCLYVDRLPMSEGHTHTVRVRRGSETAAESDLIYNRARRGGMAWTRPIEPSDIVGGLLGAPKEHWVLPMPGRPGVLGGVLWVESSGWQQTPRLSLFLDPVLDDAAARRALLARVLGQGAFKGRALRLETVADDPPVDDLLRAAGFYRERCLIQMRKVAMT